MNIQQPTITHYLHNCLRNAEIVNDTERHNALKFHDQKDWASLYKAVIRSYVHAPNGGNINPINRQDTKNRNETSYPKH